MYLKKIINKKNIPWWMRIIVKIFLARLPFTYNFWKALHFFEHGEMNQPRKSIEVFLTHAQTAGLIDFSQIPPRVKKANQYTLLEIGPGDSLFTAVLAKCFQFKQSWLVDAGYYAEKDINLYRSLIEQLHLEGYEINFSAAATTTNELLDLCNAKYLTGGIDSLKDISSNSVNYCFSNAVLEHIPLVDFKSMVQELYRVMHQEGVSVHRVDLKDHLGGELNNLRFSKSIWESRCFTQSGFYTNRIRYSEMLRIFSDAGFLYSISKVSCWDKLPTPVDKLHISFREIPLEDLLVSGFDIVLTKIYK
jgi:hypothetical protein